MEIKYNIIMPSEPAAGIIGFTDSITVNIESGDPGGDDGEFAEFMRDCLSDWYDGASVWIDK